MSPHVMSKELAKQEFMEYSQLKELLDYGPTNGIYEELMKKEENVLKTINRLVDRSNQKQLESEEIINMSFTDLYKHFNTDVYKMFNELFEVKTTDDLRKFFKDAKRSIYLGIFVVLVSLFMFFVVITN
jgi:hypothetical protein